MRDQPRKKLIEVALPLDEINAACKADKDRKTGTLRNLHKWFAPMPLPAWRALLFAALIDDPADDERRAYLLDVIKRLVKNGASVPDVDTVDEARRLLAEQFPEGMPKVMDPFCGGGSTLVEAQRLGLPTQGSDLNPVPVAISRTLTELLPQALRSLREGDGASRSTQAEDPDALFAKLTHDNMPLRARLAREIMDEASVVQGLAAQRLAGHYPHPAQATPVLWLWVRTVPCPNPACGVEAPLATSWWLCKTRSDLAWVEPELDASRRLAFRVAAGRNEGGPGAAPKLGRGASFACFSCGQTIREQDLIAAGQAGQIGLRMTAVVEDHGKKRVYRAPTPEEVQAAFSPSDENFPHITMPDIPRWFSGPRFGFTTQADNYTERQRYSLGVIADFVSETEARLLSAGVPAVRAKAIQTVLGLAVGKLAQYNCTQVFTDTTRGPVKVTPAFSSHALPMLWDFAECFPLSEGRGGWLKVVQNCLLAIDFIGLDGEGTVAPGDARTAALTEPGLVATDPPYFDAIGYADLSDFFYVWHRRTLRSAHPDLYLTVAAPKKAELTAIPSHHGGSASTAKDYFVHGFTEVFGSLQKSLAPDLPMLVVYASKEQKGGREEETRWSSILTAIVSADFEITGTWPVLGARGQRMIGQETNSVASYVVMVCRPKPATAGTCSLADFNRTLRRELRPAVHAFQAAGILPVDLAQSAMGPGMQVYSRHRSVVDQAGDKVPVDQALRLINAALGEVLDEQEGELDPYSRFAVAWWDKHAWAHALFDEADKIARPQGISVDEAVRAGVAEYPKPGYVAVLGGALLDRAWRPSRDSLPSAWEAVHHLADRLIDGGGQLEAGRLMSDLGIYRDPAQALVYRLHDIAAKKGRTRDQERYNALISSWSDLLAISASQKDGLF